MTNIFYKEAARATFSLPLNAMRGIAALIVLCMHVLEQVKQAIYGPGFYDSVFPFNGEAAVTFFFVLSGFVLGISLAKAPASAAQIKFFAVRRLFRIMPLMFVTVTIGGLYVILIDPHMPVQSIPAEFGPLTPAQFLSAYVGYSLKPNQPIWSIYVELLGSALLPLLVATGRNKIYVFATGVVLLVFGSVRLGLQHDWNIFMINFFAGVTVLWWGRALADRFGQLNMILFWALLAALFAVVYLPIELFKTEIYDRLCNLIETAAIAPLIAVVFFCPRQFVWLEARPFRFLGDASYSLYLTHWVIVTIAVNLLAILTPSIKTFDSAMGVAAITAAMIAVMLPVCLAIAGLSYRYIEQPGQAWGREACAFLKRRSSR